MAHISDPAVDAELEIWELMAKVEDSWIVQRRNSSVLRRRQPTEPGLPRMDDEMLAPTLGNGSHEVAGKLGRVKLICTQTALHSYRNLHRPTHRPDGFSNYVLLLHQGAAELLAFASYTAGGTSTVEVDLIVAIPLHDLCRLSKFAWVAAS
eukprot:CAMPEP_0181416448 /NCGR_PEP_ID=MMETSP1110-20121109/10530_1 /TAXON_ID=174948 /ORGANISM="Symbiodinium sp., Strain CCMP421" /LENGTH=150 /DNA_ID=CAMNT_0023539367 /DNA_START=403 /DNA_END=855 /DNA_ORIENTATION=-